MIGKTLALIGGLLAVVAGIVSMSTKTPLIAHLTGIELVSGSILLPLGALGVVGGLLALYGGLYGKPTYTMIGGLVGLLAPCGLSLLAVVGGALMRK